MAVSIYDFNNQNDAISSLIRHQKSNFRSLSTACHIHPSYFSRAMKGLASLSQQQVFRIAGFLQLSEKQRDYLFLLWQRQEANSKEERDFFSARIRTLQEENQKVAHKIKAKILSAEEKRAQLETYYSETITALIHMHLTVPKWRNQPELIAEQLGITAKKLNAELIKLENLGLLVRSQDKITHVEDSIHLPEESSLSFQNHINWRLKVIQSLEKRESKSGDYHLSVVFSADEETKFKLKQVLREAVVKAQGLVGDCEKPAQVFHLMMDLF